MQEQTQYARELARETCMRLAINARVISGNGISREVSCLPYGDDTGVYSPCSVYLYVFGASRPLKLRLNATNHMT